MYRIFLLITIFVAIPQIYSCSGVNFPDGNKDSKELLLQHCRNIVRVSDSVGMAFFEGWTFKYAGEGKLYVYGESSGKLTYSYFFIRNEGDEEKSTIKVSSNGLAQFLLDHGVDRNFGSSFIYLLFHRFKQSILVEKMNSNGESHVVDTISLTEKDGFFSKADPFRHSQEALEVLKRMGVHEVHFNHKHNFRRFIIGDEQLIYYPEGRKITEEERSNSLMVAPRWYLYVGRKSPKNTSKV